MRNISCLNRILFVSFLELFVGLAYGDQSVTLTWDSNPETDVARYIVYYGAASRNYTNAINAGKATTNTITGLQDGITYFFALTAYTTNGLESGFSDEVSWPGTTPAFDVSALSPLLSRSNVILRGSTTNLVPGAWFEISQAGSGQWTNMMPQPPTNNIWWASVVLSPSNWVYRFAVSNDTYTVRSKDYPFSNIPPTKPTKLRLEIKLAWSKSNDGTWEDEIKVVVSVPVSSSGVQGFSHSVPAWTAEQ